ncbi:hypothetical protein AAG747_13170 [Rapidithrix thailandica]|uniref:Protein SirB1 N-terminal domain-containing protein n=1 Tax=Rapidithrix thailandica TaxID=413964 RepID=A0AAW9S774_9BACT
MRYIFLYTLFFLSMHMGIAQPTKSPLAVNTMEAQLIKSTLSDENLFLLMLALDEEAQPSDSQKSLHKLDLLIEKMAQYKNRQNSDFKVIKNVFTKISRHYLNQYIKNSTLAHTLKNGEFNCLSGTVLLAYTLQKLGYQYSLYEANYHVYLMVNLAEGEILLEPTQPFYGYYHQPNMIAKRLNQYQKEGEVVYSQGAYRFPETAFKKVTLKELAGLQYFNQGVKAYNQQSFDRAFYAAMKAHFLYPCTRNKALIILTKKARKLQIIKEGLAVN